MNILIIEDSKSVAHIIGSILENCGYIVQLTSPRNINERFLREKVFDMCLINTSLHEGTLPILKEMRMSSKNILILGISTKSTWKEKVEFLNNGGDDVLDYPFPMQEIVARIKSLLRRPKENNEGVLKIKGIEIDNDLKQVKKNRRNILLRRREFALLEYLARNKNRTISRMELLTHVWDYRRAMNSNTVDVHVKRLRDKLRDKDLIETIHGFGYALKEKAKRKPKL